METKICSKCKEEKGLSEFRKEKKGKYGVQSKCRRCMSQIDLSYRERNRDAIRAKPRDRHKYKTKIKQYYEDNKDLILTRNRKWKESNRDKANMYSKSRVINMTDSYVYHIIKSQTGLDTQIIRQNPELIQLKRLEIALKRKRKEITKK